MIPSNARNLLKKYILVDKILKLFINYRYKNDKIQFFFIILYVCRLKLEWN